MLNPHTFELIGRSAVHLSRILADPTQPPAAPISVQFNSSGLMRFMISVVAPLLLAALGIVILVRAKKGELSATMNSTAVALVGLLFLGGATTLVFIGAWLSDLVVTHN